jgi:pimeloyl-ACP methyl ester carboxylesterase
MRDVPGRQVPVNGRAVYAEESGQGNDWVVFEAGGGCGRTCWDPVLPFLAGKARLVAYDRAGRALSGPATRQLSVDDLAADLVAMTEAIVPGEFLRVPVSRPLRFPRGHAQFRDVQRVGCAASSPGLAR